MTFPMPFVPPMGEPAALAYLTRINTSDPNGYGESAYNSFASFPTGIQAGDLLVATVWGNSGTTFRAASGFTLLHSTGAPSGMLVAVKVADGTESGSTGGLVNSIFGDYVEVIEAHRFNLPISSFVDLSIGVGNSTHNKPSDEIIQTGSNGSAPIFAIAGYGSGSDMTNSDIKSPTGALWSSPDYGNNGPEVKTRGWFWGADDSPSNLTIGFINDPGGRNTIIGAAIEVR